MEKPARLQTVLPEYARRGSVRVVDEKHINPRSIPFLDGEFNQWYLVGRINRGRYWRPYTVTAIVLECVMLFIPAVVMAKTLFSMNFHPGSVYGALISHRNLLARQHEEWSSQIVQAFDTRIAGPNEWFTRLLLSVSIVQIVFSLFAIILLSGQEKRLLIWISFSLHVMCAVSLVPFAVDLMAKEVIDFGGFYGLVSNDRTAPLSADSESFLKVWVQSVSFYEKRYMRFRSEDTLVRFLERDIGCCGMESVNEYSWQQDLNIYGAVNNYLPPFDIPSLQRYILNDWRVTEYRRSNKWMSLPPMCCPNCSLSVPSHNKTDSRHRKPTKMSPKNVTAHFTSFSCLSKMADLQSSQLYPMYGLASLLFTMNVLLCVFIGMRNFCKWVTEGVDEEKYIEEIKQAKLFRDKLRDRKRVLNEGANEIYNTKIRVDKNRNRLAIQTQITQYVPTHKKKHRKKHFRSKI